ncbi:alpha-L-arabinofuranosidase [Alicyclobacillus acidiphilus]|uniref:alpha-L-arabinofuranosidase n=1 Tax=Alicyclobacillus acidiphilus TaxID=182455 RepID=UPI000832B60A|nr:alpha-L-arabinofuranosidase [Alicyclobacillus acidiphilus]
MNRKFIGTLAAILTIGTSVPGALAATSSVTSSTAGQPVLSSAIKDKLTSLVPPGSASNTNALNTLVADLAAIHDALTIPELQAVQKAATASQALTSSQWDAIVFPNTPSAKLSKDQQNAVRLIADMINLISYDSVSNDGQNVQTLVSDMQSISPLINAADVYQFFYNFASSVGSQSSAIVGGQSSDAAIMTSAIEAALEGQSSVKSQMPQFAVIQTDIANVWNSYQALVDADGSGLKALLSGIISTYLGFAAPTASATVTVNTASNLGAIPSSAFGINTAVWDSGFEDPTLISEVKALSPDVLRFPGGSDSDNYHWATNTLINGLWGNSDDTFDHFMGFANNTGAQAMITVNYGSGTADEAAAWVKYANVTHNYDVKYWEIGNEIYGNGYYNGNGWETDQHAVAGDPEEGNPGLSPQTYANNAEQYITEMKAQDPSIKVGAVLTMPYNWPWGATVNGNDDWNTTVLKTIGQDIDFVDVHWYPETPGQETDAGLLADTNQIPAMIQELRKEIDEYAGSNAKNIQIFVTETNNTSSTPGQQSNNLVNALFLDDDLAGFIQAGAANVDWWDLLNSAGDGYNSPFLYGQNLFGDEGLLSSGQTSPDGAKEPPLYTPLPTYYGYQMLADFAKPGDTMLGTLSSQSMIDPHAVKLPNGDVSVMLVNKDPSNTYNVSLNLEGYAPAFNATEEIYGEGSPSVTTTQVSRFNSTVKLPPYSVTDVLLHPIAPATNTQQMSVQTTLSGSTVTPSGTQTITATFTNNGLPVSRATLDLELYDSTGNLVAEDTVPNVTLGHGASQQVTWSWTAPNTPGDYTVEAYAFGGAGGVTYLANNDAADFSVSSPTLAKFGDIVTQNTTVTVTGPESTTGTVYTIPVAADGSYDGSTNIPVTSDDTVTITTTFKNVSQSDYLDNAILDMEVDGSTQPFQYFTQSNNLAPGQSITLTKSWTVGSTASGTYKLGFQADNNNTWGGSNTCYYQPNVAVFTVTNTSNSEPLAKYGDIVAQNTTVTVTPASTSGSVYGPQTYNIPAGSDGSYDGSTNIDVTSGDTVTITTTFENVSTSDYLQNAILDMEVDGASQPFQYFTQSNNLAPGQSVTLTGTWTVGSTTAAGTYKLGFQADNNNTWGGSDNCYYQPNVAVFNVQ